MDKNKIILSISGMHCRSCEILIEDSLAQIAGIQRTVVNYKKGTAEIYSDEPRKPSMQTIEHAIREAGYNIGYGNNERKPFFSKNPEDYKDLGIAFFFLIGIFIILKNLGITDIGIDGASNPSSLPVVFLVGLTAGLSTCMALVGGLILGISARHSELHPEATAMQKFRPHLFFNLGRIGGYAVLGGILGSLGSVLQLSGGTLGVLTIGVGMVMLILGMKLVGIFPRLENKSISLPSGISKLLGIRKHEKEYSHKGSLITGALTFFLPCGFTQAMQLYAISMGSFTQGALIMGIFALGTAPGLLGVGGLTSVIKGIFAKRFFKFAGVLVVILSLFNITNGYNLTGWQLGSSFAANNSQTVEANDPNVTMENGVQVVKMKEIANGYTPNKFTIKKGVPVKWIIDAEAPRSCAASIMISKLGIRKTLKAGENIIEFTPTESGKLPFSCAMGMYTGVFNVVDEKGSGTVWEDEDSSDGVATASSGGTCGGSGGGCGGCGGGGGGVQIEKDTMDTIAKVDNGIQTVSTTYTADNYLQPNSFKVKAGMKVKLTIDVKDSGRGCGSAIMIPGLYDNVTPIQAGEPIVMEFTPEKGIYDITCGMNMINYGTVTVE